VILGATFAGIATVVLATIAVTLYYVQRRRWNQDIDGDFNFDQLPSLPMKFSYEKLRLCTEDFGKKLGEGGFGSFLRETRWGDSCSETLGKCYARKERILGRG
jgi:hypothetical protein